jgi:hypothetical protein
MANATNIQNCKYLKMYYLVLNFRQPNYRTDFQLFVQYHLHNHDFIPFANAFLELQSSVNRKFKHPSANRLAAGIPLGERDMIQYLKHAADG